MINSLEGFLSLHFFQEKYPKPFANRKTRQIPSLIVNINILFKFSPTSNHYESHLRISDISTLESIPNPMFLALQSRKRRID